MTTPLDLALLERCANDPKGPVALHMATELLPVEGRGQPFFPATFAMESKYNIDELADGTRVALVDSVGSQANRMEPLFLEEEYADLVPQVTIRYGDPKKGTDGQVSLLEAGHRVGDAVLRCTSLAASAHEAFVAAGKGDCGPMARLGPTSLVFGAWDSRDTGVKLPRIVQSVIRAWDVSRLSRSAQFVPALDYQALGVVADDQKLEKDKKTKSGLAERGFLHVPSTGDHGGVIATGPIRRNVTVNLIALRRLQATERAEEMRRYILGLALIAATAPLDPFLRQGCLLVPDADRQSEWNAVSRSGSREAVEVDREGLIAWARSQAEVWGVAEDQTVDFDEKLAKEDMKKGAK